MLNLIIVIKINVSIYLYKINVEQETKKTIALSTEYRDHLPVIVFTCTFIDVLR